jgi:hypothetical protein
LQYLKEYRETHKEQLSEYFKQYREEHKEELALKNKLEIEEMKRQWKEYIQTDAYKQEVAERKKSYKRY